MENQILSRTSAAHEIRTIAVVVTFNPCLDGLDKLLTAVTQQVSQVLIVDNGSNNVIDIESIGRSRSEVSVRPLGGNYGIGYAQNIGFYMARELGANYVLTLDQDSVPSLGMVARLVAVHDSADEGAKIAAVGPILLDESTGLPLPFFSYASGRKRRITPAAGSEILEVGFLVSSGTVISMGALESIGLMREELFIAYVDVEFCLRARAHNYRVLACCSTSMAHNLGDRRIRIGRWMIPLHSPVRHFYLMRSGIYMQKLASVPAVWKRGDRLQLVRSLLVFSLAGLPRLHEVFAMMRGIAAGLRMKVRPQAHFDISETS